MVTVPTGSDIVAFVVSIKPMVHSNQYASVAKNEKNTVNNHIEQVYRLHTILSIASCR